MTIIFALPDPQSMIGFFFLESCLLDIVFFPIDESETTNRLH